MNALARFATAGAILLTSGALAFAECVDVGTTATTSDALRTPPIEKDGSLAPLEQEARDPTGEREAGPVQKDGGTLPLASDEADDNTDLATSQQDVEAQQKGGRTAAAEAEDERERIAAADTGRGC